MGQVTYFQSNIHFCISLFFIANVIADLMKTFQKHNKIIPCLTLSDDYCKCTDGSEREREKIYEKFLR